MALRPADFESAASTGSAIPALKGQKYTGRDAGLRVRLRRCPRAHRPASRCRSAARAGCCTWTRKPARSRTSSSPICPAARRPGGRAGAERHARDEGAPRGPQGERRQDRAVRRARARASARRSRSSVQAIRRRPGTRSSSEDVAVKVEAREGELYRVRFSKPVDGSARALRRGAAAALHPPRAAGARTPSATRPCTRECPARSPRPPPACISIEAHAAEARAARARRSPKSRCTSAPAPSSRCASTKIEAHRMHSERYASRRRPSTAISARRRRRVLAVGTTSAARAGVGGTSSGTSSERRDRLFITPASSSASSTRLLTNFHLPRSTLLMLVSAFAGMREHPRGLRARDRRALPLLLLRRRDADRDDEVRRSCNSDGAARRGMLELRARPRRDAGVHAGRHLRHGEGDVARAS